ncbi:hypothetical protein DH2020_024563 [Rehmannia glutinosa]|uniref:Reverse transcriptase Ty1/copia-type domain-containing protein n=1 Tax=Rehmannia glutinosa TaxID=99300 RepID=A0ABR0W695_REHGL
MDAEYSALVRNQTWELVPRQPHMNVVDNKWVFRIKYNSDGSIQRHKARLVAKGFQQQPGIDFFETFSPVVKPTTIRVMLTLAVTYNWDIQQIDIDNAFLNGSIDEEVWDAILLALVYVDDILLTGNNSQHVLDIISHLRTQFSLKTLGSVTYFLGFETTRGPDGIHLSQTKYTIDLLKKTNMLEAHPCPTPMNQSNKLHLQDSEPFEHATLYRSVIGALQYLTLSRPDIAFSVNKLSQFLQFPTQNHWQACKRILRYLAGSIGEGIKFTRAPTLSIESFCDSDWASSLDDRKSTSGYCVYFGGNLVSWSSRKQKSVARSSTEAEYRALAQASTEIIWLKSLLSEIGIINHEPSIIWCDNSEQDNSQRNPSFHSRTKHIEIDIHYIRDKVLSKEIEVRYIPSEEQVADILTKPLTISRFHKLKNKSTIIHSPQRHLEGAC